MARQFPNKLTKKFRSASIAVTKYGLPFSCITIINRTKNAGPPCRTNKQKKFLISGTYMIAFLSVSVTCVLKVITSHGLMKNIDTKAKCRHLKKLTCKGTLRQMFIRVIDTVSHVGIFDLAL